MKRRSRKISELIPAFVIWLIVSIVFWGWIYTLITDTTAEYKICIAVDSIIADQTAFNAALEKDLRGNIRMIRAYPFTYAMMSDISLQNADILIIREENIPDYRIYIAALPEIETDLGKVVMDEEKPVGIRIDPERAGLLKQFTGIENKEAFILCFGKNSIHLNGNPAAIDNESIYYAGILLGM